MVVVGGADVGVAVQAAGCGVRTAGRAEVDGSVASASGELGGLVFGPEKADLESFDFAEPAFAFGFGHAVGRVAADLGEPGLLGRVGPEHGTEKQACSWTQGVAKARPQVRVESLRRSKWPRNSSHSSSVGVRSSSVGRSA